MHKNKLKQIHIGLIWFWVRFSITIRKCLIFLIDFKYFFILTVQKENWEMILKFATLILGGMDLGIFPWFSHESFMHKFCFFKIALPGC